MSCNHPHEKWRDAIDPDRPFFVRTVCACGKFLGYRDLEQTGEVSPAKPPRNPRARRAAGA